jgi:hypothetical protein
MIGSSSHETAKKDETMMQNEALADKSFVQNFRIYELTTDTAAVDAIHGITALWNSLIKVLKYESNSNVAMNAKETARRSESRGP